MNAIASYFGKGEPIKNIPKQVEMSKQFLLQQGVTSVSLIGTGLSNIYAGYDANKSKIKSRKKESAGAAASFKKSSQLTILTQESVLHSFITIALK